MGTGTSGHVYKDLELGYARDEMYETRKPEIQDVRTRTTFFSVSAKVGVLSSFCGMLFIMK